MKTKKGRVILHRLARDKIERAAKAGTWCELTGAECKSLLRTVFKLYDAEAARIAERKSNRRVFKLVKSWEKGRK